MIVSAIRPPNSPARIDSIGNPGTGPGGRLVVTLVLVVLVVDVEVEVDVSVVVSVIVDVEVVVAGMTSGP
jgi:hypothetical protein